jgi:hypothetical protein
MKSWLTTGEIAKALNVAVRTVVHWIDNGQLKGVRIPSASITPKSKGDRRVYRDDFEAFCREYGFRVNGDSVRCRPLVLTLGCVVEEPDGLDIVEASSVFEAGILTERLKPDVIVVDWLAIGRLQARQIVDGVAPIKGYEPFLVGITNSNELANEILETGFHQPIFELFYGRHLIKILGDVK